MGDALQTCFESIQKGQVVRLVHDHVDGRQVSALVQAAGKPLAFSRYQGWQGRLVLSRAVCQVLASSGMVRSAASSAPVTEALANDLKAFSAKGFNYDGQAALTLPWESVPTGGGQSRYCLAACAYDLVRWASPGSFAWLMQPEDQASLTSTAEYPSLSTSALMRYATLHRTLIERVSSSLVPLGPEGLEANVVVYRALDDDCEHVALVFGEIEDRPCPVRLHSECLTGDVFASQRCDCGWQLHQSMQAFQQQSGVLLYLRQEGRGIGLGHKIQAYDLQRQGLDTVEANHQLGFGADERSYGVAVQILQDLGINQIKLLTNNPVKIDQLAWGGIVVVEREILQLNDVHACQHAYLSVKKSKLGHWLDEPMVVAKE